MAQLDRLKEEVGYLKFWQGVVVLTDASLIGWLASAFDTAPTLKLVLAVAGVILLTFAAMMLHRGIQGRMVDIGKP